MARVFPSVDQVDFLPVPLNTGETQVLELLKRLDDSWHVYVQPRIDMDRPDFVVLHPKLGVTAIEVKDWSPSSYQQRTDGIIERRETGGWVPTSHRPRFQAYRYKDTIQGRFFSDVNAPADLFKSVRAVVVMVRHTTAEARALLDIPSVCEAEKWIAVFGGCDLEDHPMRVLTGSDRPCGVKIPAGNIDRLRRALAEPEALSDRRLPLSMSSAARNIESNPNGAKVRRVRGAAGSGKSLGLAARAALLASQGKRVLVVTYNATLPQYLHELAARRCNELKANVHDITFMHLHDFASRVCDDARAEHVQLMSSELFPDKYDEVIDRAADAYRKQIGPKFDAILVDEGQDFSLKWWNILRQHALVPGGEMLLVADPTQDLYGKKAWTDEEKMSGAGFSGPWTEVSGSYRMPPDLIPVVAGFAAKHVDGARVDPDVPSDHPLLAAPYEPTVRRWVNLERGMSPGRALGLEVVQLLKDNPDLSPGDVVFLTSSHRVGLQAVRVIAEASLPVQHLFSEDPSKRGRLKRQFSPTAPGVKGCTVHSFKGWESRAVVLEVSSMPESHRLAYVGLTRVKGDLAHRAAYVTVVNSDAQLRGFRDQFVAS